MSDVVKKYLEGLREDDRLFNGFELEYHYEKGGLWNGPDRRIRRWIEDHDERENVLLIVGKSYGGKDSAKIINKIGDSLAYKKKYVLTVDPCWITCFHGSYLHINRADKVWNFYQRNEVFMNGAKVKVPEGTELYEKDISDETLFPDEGINLENINHFNIVKSVNVEYCFKSIVREITS
jgi:hypothetical protein